MNSRYISEKVVDMAVASYAHAFMDLEMTTIVRPHSSSWMYAALARNASRILDVPISVDQVQVIVRNNIDKIARNVKKIYIGKFEFFRKCLK